MCQDEYDYKTGNEVLCVLGVAFIISVIIVCGCLLIKEQMDYIKEDKGQAEQHITID